MEERSRKAQQEMTDAANAMLSQWLSQLLRGIVDDPLMSQLWSAMKTGNRERPRFTLDPYRVLGLEKTATDDQVKKRYRELARYFHPDTAAVQGTGFFFLQVQAAYEVIRQERGWH
jgi:preprotein translocase subunit Sec63